MIPSEILNYIIIRKIGEGGMGQVFLARNKSIDQYVAIKMLHPRYGNNPLLRDKLRKEAIVLSSLNHPGIVKFLNYVENDNGVFLIMEYVEGMTLEDFINKKNGLIVEQRAYPMMKEILDAFAYAHGRGIIHRDIKPGNIYINTEGHIKVLDFGIAQIVSEVTSEADNQGGTPSYMSPEQVLNRKVDIRSDIYSLGVMFHHMLTGKPPYDTTTLTHFEIKQQVTSDRLKRMKDFYPYVSDGMQNVIDIATRKNPDSRFRNCMEFQKSIDKVLNPVRKNRWLLYGGIAAGALVLAGGFLIWDYNRTKVRYYNDYAEVWEVPEGIGRVSASEMKHRELTYRMEFSKGKLRRMTLVNSAGNPVEHRDTEHSMTRYSDTEYFYSDDGRVDFKRIYNSSGKFLFKLDYDENLKTAALKHDDEYGTPMRLTSNTTDYYSSFQGADTRGSVTHFLLTHDEDTGYLTKKLYAGNNNERIGDSDNVFGMAYAHDSKGRVTQLTYLDAEGKPRNNKFGLGIRKYKYDDNDLWTEVAYYTSAGQPSHDGNNCFAVKLEYDRYGNRIAEKYYGSDGKPAMRADSRCFGFAYERDERGNCIKYTYTDADGKPMTGKNNLSAMVNEYDDAGYCVMETALDIDGKPVFGIEEGEPVASVRQKVDSKGRPVEIRNFGKDGKGATTTTGFSILTLEYDSLGNPVRYRYFDASGNPAQFANTYSEEVSQYDNLGRLTSVRYKDGAGHPTRNKEGVYGFDIIYDKNGNCGEFRNIGSDGKSLALDRNGIAYAVRKYDDTGNQTSYQSRGLKGEPVAVNGIIRSEYVYERKNNFRTEERDYGMSGLIETRRFEYDDSGNITRQYTLGANGRLKPGTCVFVSKYDSFGNLTESQATDLSGNKINYPGEKYSMLRKKYDSHGNQTDVTFFAANGAKATDQIGTHHRINRYDSANRIIYEKNLGTDGKPLKGSNASAEGKVEYDDRGNRTAILCYDGYGKPAKSHLGVHKEAYSYDDKNRITRAEMTDEKGRLVDSGYGYARSEYKYDADGNLVSQKFYKSSGKLHYETRNTYNSKNNLTSQKIYNASGRLDDSIYGVSQLTITYVNDGVTPRLRSYKTASGQTLATEKYNPATDKWSII